MEFNISHNVVQEETIEKEDTTSFKDIKEALKENFREHDDYSQISETSHRIRTHAGPTLLYWPITVSVYDANESIRIKIEIDQRIDFFDKAEEICEEISQMVEENL